MRKGSPPGGGRQAAVSPNTVGQGLGQVSSPRGAEDSQLWRSCRRAAHSGESDHLVGPDCVDDSDSLQTPQSPRVPPSGRSARWPLSQPQSSRTELSLTLTPCTQLSGVACRACPPPVSHRLGAVTHMAPSTPGPHVSTSNLSARGDQGPWRWAGQELGDSEDLMCWEQKRQSWDLPKGLGAPVSQTSGNVGIRQTGKWQK